MHKYLRSIGFSELKNKKELKEILTDVVKNSTDGDILRVDDQLKMAVMSKDVSHSLGISVFGEYDENGHFVYDYYFPYLKSKVKSIVEEISVERHSSQISFAGICEEVSFGVILIFYLQNFIEYFDAREEGSLKRSYVSLSGLSTNGNILLPIEKSQMQRRSERRFAQKRKELMQEARKGVEDAIESLTMQDMGLYNTISKKILQSDVYSMVDSTFIPCGVESDHYAVLGEILKVKKEHNMYTKEGIFVLTINCNDIIIDIAINEKDLSGEPTVGRRFKGDIWLQGAVCIPKSETLVE